MRRSHLKARLLRALSGKTQEQFSDEIDVHRSLISQIELGTIEPSQDHLARMARSAELTEPDAEELLRHYESLRQMRARRRQGGEDPLPGLAARLRNPVAAAYRRLLALPRPRRPPGAEDRARAEAQWERLKDLPEEVAIAVVRVAEEYQSWALYEKVCEESGRQAGDAQRAAALARLAAEIERQAPPRPALTRTP